MNRIGNIVLLSLFIIGFLAKELMFSFIRYLEKNNVLFGLLFSLIVYTFFFELNV
jgi:hypothetical protein